MCVYVYVETPDNHADSSKERKRHLVGSCCYLIYVVKIGQGACVGVCVSTWISGLVTSSTMLLASSLDSKATAFSLSCTSQPLICASKASIDGHV